MDEIELIKELNYRLGSIQTDVNQEFNSKSMPTTLILGCPRSGTTALIQYLAETGSWAYPTNILTRFSNSVYVGSLVQELLFNPGFGLIKEQASIDYKSDYGRSIGALNTNEFFHFFRRFFPTNDICHLSKEELLNVDVNGILREIASITKVQKKPFVAKGLMFQSNLEYFSKLMPNCIFLYIKREPQFVMQSIYKARLQECDDVKEWWSAKPAEYNYLVTQAVEKQIAGQVYYIQSEIEYGMRFVPEGNKLIVDYEDFVKNPEAVYLELAKKYKNLGYELSTKPEKLKRELKASHSRQIDQSIMDLMSEAFNRFEADSTISKNS